MPNALTLGVATGGRIDPAGDTDYFSLTLAESTIDIWVRAVGENQKGTDPLPVAGELLDADSNTLHTYEASDFNDAIGFSGTNQPGGRRLLHQGHRDHRHVNGGLHHYGLWRTHTETGSRTAVPVTLSAFQILCRGANGICATLVNWVTPPVTT